MRVDIHHTVDVHFHAPREVVDILRALQRDQRTIMAKLDDVLTAIDEVGTAVDELEAAITASRGELSPENQEKVDAALAKLHRVRDDARDKVDEAAQQPGEGGGGTPGEGGGDTGGGDTGGGTTAEATARRGR